MSVTVRYSRETIEQALDFHQSQERIKAWKRGDPGPGYLIRPVGGELLQTRSLRETWLCMIMLASAHNATQKQKLICECCINNECECSGTRLIPEHSGSRKMSHPGTTMRQETAMNDHEIHAEGIRDVNENNPRAWHRLTSHTPGLPGAIVQRLRHAEELELAACVLEAEFGQLYATSPDDQALDERALRTLRSRARHLRQLADEQMITGIAAARQQDRRLP